MGGHSFWQARYLVSKNVEARSSCVIRRREISKRMKGSETRIESISQRIAPSDTKRLSKAAFRGDCTLRISSKSLHHLLVPSLAPVTVLRRPKIFSYFAFNIVADNVERVQLSTGINQYSTNFLPFFFFPFCFV